jgi:hypothetical protein
MTTRVGAAALAAILALAGCGGGGYGPGTATDAAIGEEMMRGDPMVPSGEIDDATGSEIP